MTARLATHPDIAGLTRRVLRQLHNVGMDVDFVGEFDAEDPFASLRAHEIDMALVGLSGIASIVRGEFTAVAVLPRMETRDVLVSLEARAKSLSELPPGTPVGVTGLRRRALLAAHRPDLVPLELGVEVAEQPALQERVAAEVDARHDVGRAVGHLLGLGEEIVDHAV